MGNLQVNVVVSLILSVAFFIVFLVTLRVLRQRKFVHLGAVYALVSSLWLIIQVTSALQLATEIDPQVLMMLPLVILVFLALVFLAWSSNFLPYSLHHSVWVSFGSFWFISLLLIVTRIVKLPELLRVNQALVFSYPIQVIVLAWIGWGIMVAGTIWMTWISFRESTQPMHRNRIGYWALALVCLICADLLGFFNQSILSGTLRLAGCLLAIYVASIHNLVDISNAATRMLIAAIVSLFGIILYAVTFSLVGTLLIQNLENSPVSFGMLLGLLAVLLTPVLILTDRFLRRFAYGINHQTRIVREYSLGISNILDLERLAEMALGFIQQKFSSTHVSLMLVDRPPGGMAYRFLPVPIDGNEPHPAGSLGLDSPFVTYFWQNNRPLPQYDIDLLSQFHDMNAEELHWLNMLHADVFVPVFSKGDLIGLFVLGAKITGERYYEEDLFLLATLADQTAVALENARLFDTMTRLNQDLQQAHRALQDANHQLTELDTLKSTFIGVVTHEMRTPLANLAFSLQLLELYGTDSLSADQREQIDLLKHWMGVSREMVENLITFASFFSGNVELNQEMFDFREVVSDVLQNRQDQAKERSVQIHTNYAGEDFTLYADRKLLFLALTQLVQNAIKFNKEEGQVWLACWTTNNVLFCDIQDTGIGIPNDQLDAIWNGFNQVVDPLKRGMEGLGLGLALVKFIVSSHKGKVWVESEQGKGSAFGFQIPKLDQRPRTDPLIARHPQRSNQKRENVKDFP